MPNKRYINGRRKEYKIVNDEKSRGNIAFRSAGSHSFTDVVSIDVEKRIIKFIQSKPNSWNEKQIQTLTDEYKFINGVYEVIFSVV